ncbi:replication initiation protein [Chryseobacterium limigenitum]|uniref:replication initiation protein n=1 Tax=Chryseobacterium limigenitum TaxID=1612149 RepID=UPI0009FA4F20
MGKRIFEVQELKEILCVEDKYAKYANFKKRVLLKAQEDIEKHTDIRFTFEEISEFSRSVEKLVFTIHKNKKTVIESDNTNNDTENENESGKENKWHDEIKSFGVSQSVLENQILAEFEEEFVKQTLKFCKDYFKTTSVKQKS